jgi:hypothetical protein
LFFLIKPLFNLTSHSFSSFFSPHSDIKDRCVLKLVELNKPAATTATPDSPTRTETFSAVPQQITINYQQQAAPLAVSTSQYYGIADTAASAAAAAHSQQVPAGPAPPMPMTNASLRSLSEPRHPMPIPHPSLAQANLTPSHHHHPHCPYPQQLPPGGYNSVKLNQALSMCMAESEAVFTNTTAYHHHHHHQVPGTVAASSTTLVETYDNLNEMTAASTMNGHKRHHHNHSQVLPPPPLPPPHYSRIDSSRLNHFERYSAGAKPIYSSMRVANSSSSSAHQPQHHQRAGVKSIDHDLINYFDSLTHHQQQQQQQQDYASPVHIRNHHSSQPPPPRHRHSIFNTPLVQQQLAMNHQRDIRSCDRELAAAMRDMDESVAMYSTTTVATANNSVMSKQQPLRAGSVTPSHYYYHQNQQQQQNHHHNSSGLVKSNMFSANNR